MRRVGSARNRRRASMTHGLPLDATAPRWGSSITVASPKLDAVASVHATEVNGSSAPCRTNVGVDAGLAVSLVVGRVSHAVHARRSGSSARNAMSFARHRKGRGRRTTYPAQYGDARCVSREVLPAHVSQAPNSLSQWNCERNGRPNHTNQPGRINAAAAVGRSTRRMRSGFRAAAPKASASRGGQVMSA